MCAPSSGPGLGSATPPTGRNISAIILRTAAATCSSISTLSGPIRRSISSASTTTCRSPTGATASIISTRRRAGLRSTTGPICRRTLRVAKGLSGSMPAPPIAPRRSAPRSPMAPQASHGSSATRTCAPGGQSLISTARAGWRAGRPPHGCLNPNRSGSPSWAVRPSTGARTSQTCSLIRSRRKALRPTSRAAGAMTRSSAPTWKRPICSGRTRPTIRCPISMPRPWCICPNAPPGPGTRAPIRSFRR